MMSFWITTLLLLGLAAVFVLWPLRYRESGPSKDELNAYSETNVELYRVHLAELEQGRQEGRFSEQEFQELKLEQERALLEDEEQLRKAQSTWTLSQVGLKFLCVVFVAVVLVAGGLYQYLGNIEDVRLLHLQQEKFLLDWEDLEAQRNPDPQRTRDLVSAIEARLEQRPDNLQYRFLLARYAMSLGDYERAIDAYEQVVAVDRSSPRVLAELAQALFLGGDNQMTPHIASLAHSALAIDPEETTALGLAGINAFSEGDYPQAIGFWQRAIDIMGPDAASSQSLQVGIERAKREMAGEAGEEVSGNSSPLSQDEVAPVSVSVRVTLGEDAQVSPEQWVFVYARAWEGSPMPLAIKRIQASDLPATIILDDTMAMTASSTLSQAGRVELVARASQTSTAAPKPGDWEGRVGPVDPKANRGTIDLTIDQEITD